MTFPYKIENNNNVEPGRVFAKYVYISEKSCFEKKVLVIMLLFVTRDLPLFLFLEQYLQCITLQRICFRISLDLFCYES